MAFEKAKVLKAAEKFLAQGKINAAIKEYRQIVDHDVDDLTTLNMLGDLYVRSGKKEEAVSCFDRIAEHYSAQEFNLKAIAMYKKIERLRPRDPIIAFKLAELYASQGLVHDARSQYLVVADSYTRSGDNKRALEILHKIADLDPNNTDIRLKLADGYLKENMRRESAAAFVQAANRFHQTGAQDQALDAYSKALQLVRDDREALRGMLETHIARGTADEAAEVLERVVETREDDNELVSMLARAYLEAEDPKGAEKATSLLMAQDASNYTQFLPVTRLYLKVGEVDETIRILSTVIERMLAGREERELLEIVNQVLDRNPDHVAALRMLVRIHWWQRDMDALRSSLERLAESAEASELVDEERYALTQLVRLAPDEQRYLDRLNLLGGLQEETAEDFSPLPEPENEVPQFETFAVVQDEDEIAAAAPVTADEFETNATPASTFSDPTASFADLNEQSFADLSETGSAPSATSANDFQEVDFSIVTPVDTAAPAAAADSAEGGEPLDNMMRQELESVDFYIAQGYADIAVDTLEMLEKQFGMHPEIKARRDKLAARDKQPEAPAVFEFGGVEELTATPATEAVTFDSDTAYASLAGDGGNNAGTAKPVAKGIDSGLAELFEEFRAAEEGDEVREDFETHYNMGTAYKEMDLMDEAIQEFQTSVGLVKPGDGTSRFLQCCNMLGHCFIQKGMPEAAVLWFKKGLQAPGHTEDEYQALRYELASAYEQLGDLKQAREFYTEVYGVDVSYREVAEKLSQLRQKQE
ncbi:MAG TPA: tetratricopeptide repeat protein [Pyrinomonadaceae bacterium]|jgi:tetratricopeptide (TPR) repeat protein|nr:tetratricopeptide repeat protein [Pyrinomonadaceae bacterium]